MRKQHKSISAIQVLGFGCLLLAGAPVLAAQQARADGRVPWAESPFRSFGPVRSLSPFVILQDEADDPALVQVLSQTVARLSAELFDRDGWPMPFAAGDPLRVLVTRREADRVARLVARSRNGPALAGPALEIDGTGLSNDEIVQEAARLFALAAISSYGVADAGFLTTAAAEFLSGNGDGPAESAVTVAAAPAVGLAAHARTMGRALLREFADEAGGSGALRLIWERASERGEDPLTSLVQIYAERTGNPGEALLVRFAARLYANLEPEPGPSSISLYDLEAGSFDAAAPAAWTFRHRTFVPAEAAGSLRYRWPAGAGAAAAVVRYRDPELPADVVFLEPESIHSVALSGVARIDWVVAGAASPGPVAPAFFEMLAGYPFANLVPHAAPSTDGARLWWTTASHEGLAGWAVFREEVEPDGRIVRSDPQVVPASEEAAESFRYAFVDPGTRPATCYRYTVWAVTQDGLLAKAFSATLRTPE